VSQNWRRLAERRVTGVPLLPAVVADLRDIAARTGIPFE